MQSRSFDQDYIRVSKKKKTIGNIGIRDRQKSWEYSHEEVRELGVEKPISLLLPT